MPPELTVSSLTVRFGALTALAGIDLAVRSGELVALAGENGARKTTFIRAVAGDVTPVYGSIRLGGRPVARPIFRGRSQAGHPHRLAGPRAERQPRTSRRT